MSNYDVDPALVRTTDRKGKRAPTSCEKWKHDWRGKEEASSMAECDTDVPDDDGISDGEEARRDGDVSHRQRQDRPRERQDRLRDCH